MKANVSVPRSLWLLLSSVVLSSTVVLAILAAAPLKTVRRSLGAGPFWLMGLGLSILFFGFKLLLPAIVLLVMTVAVGVWSEMEQRGFDLSASAMGGLLSSGSAAFLIFYWAIRRDPAGWYNKLIAATEQMKNKAVYATEVLKTIDVEQFVFQLPSLAVIAILVAMALAAVLERPLSTWVGISLQRREKLVDYRVPEFMIWALIASIFGAFWDGSPKPFQALSMNVLNVCVVVYFFQGMAVMCKYCDVFRISGFWRATLVVLFTFYLFFILSLLGLVDYWADFRKQFAKKSADLNKKRLSE